MCSRWSAGAVAWTVQLLQRASVMKLLAGAGGELHTLGEDSAFSRVMITIADDSNDDDATIFFCTQIIGQARKIGSLGSEPKLPVPKI